MEPFHHSPLQDKSDLSKARDTRGSTETITRPTEGSIRVYDQDSVLETIPSLEGMSFDESVAVLRSLVSNKSVTFEYSPEDHAFLDNYGETRGD